jgi:hypothetical protein
MWDSIGLWLNSLTQEQWLYIFLLVMCCVVVLGLNILIERGDNEHK